LKFFATVFLVIICYIVVRIFTLGHNFDEGGPIRGSIRNLVIGSVYRLISTMILLVAGIRMSRDDRDYDYSFYLGPNYKETTPYPKYFSTYVSNHTSWMDILLMIAYNRPAFTPKHNLKKIPLFGLLVQALGCIFVARGGTEEERN
jgi:1-acyl-sn-glycerol-3-phosphate acyltransferase